MERSETPRVTSVTRRPRPVREPRTFRNIHIGHALLLIDAVHGPDSLDLPREPLLGGCYFYIQRISNLRRTDMPPSRPFRGHCGPCHWRGRRVAPACDRHASRLAGASPVKALGRQECWVYPLGIGNSTVAGRSYHLDLCHQVAESDSTCPRHRSRERRKGQYEGTRTRY